MEEIANYTRANRVSWNEIAPRRQPQAPEFFAAGGTTLEDFEIPLLPDVRGKRLLHLACANGNESLSWAVLGARVTGVDISDVAIGLAEQTARAAELDVRFVVADMYQLPGDLGRFDVVYASAGVICWLPDLTEWAGIVARQLRPGGTFLLCEHHPIWEVLGVRGEASTSVTVDYFGRNRPTKETYDQSKRPAGSTESTVFSAFVWPVSDVVMSLANAGLRIDHFSERPYPEMYTGLGAAAARLPAVYVITATKP